MQPQQPPYPPQPGGPQQPYPPQYPPQMPYPPQQQPQRPQRPQNWFTRLSRPWQAGIGCLALLLICSCIGALGSLASKGGDTSTSTGTNATQAPQATHAPTATPKPKAWHTVQHYSGSQNKSTPTFHISSDQWRIVWKDTVTGDVGGDFSIELYSSDNTPLELVANASGSGGDTFDVHEGSGDYYMKMDVLFTNYDVQVQEYS